MTCTITQPKWYSGFNEELTELDKEDPAAYKRWLDWYEPKAKQPPWLMRNSRESLDRLKEVLDAAIKERRWTRELLREGPNNTWTACVIRRDAIRHRGAGKSEGDALLDAYLSALKGCRGSEICPWLP
jgi:hypothetical protein